jgi:hypothetical protein
MIGVATRPSDEADPSRTQKRVAVSPSGRQVLVDITQNDRLRLIHQLPGRWPDVMKAIERGETLEQIARWARVPTPCHPGCRMVSVRLNPDDPENSPLEQRHDGPPCLRYWTALIYGKFEGDLHEIAMRRARLML